MTRTFQKPGLCGAFKTQAVLPEQPAQTQQHASGIKIPASEHGHFSRFLALSLPFPAMPTVRGLCPLLVLGQTHHLWA